MQASLLLQLVILLVVANGTAVVAKKLLGVAFARPLDGGALFVDGQPLFGPSKTVRGIVLSVLATSICAAVMGLGWGVGTLVATFAMAGDLFSSFVKRRLHLASSSMAIGLDHIPESLFPLLASRWLLPLNILDIVAGVTIFVVGALILSPAMVGLLYGVRPTDPLTFGSVALILLAVAGESDEVHPARHLLPAAAGVGDPHRPLAPPLSRPAA